MKGSAGERRTTRKKGAAEKPLTVPLATDDLQGTVAAAASTAVFLQSTGKGDLRATGGKAAPRSTDTVLEDILHTYTGIVSIAHFRSMQAATIKLTEDIKKGSAFAHGDVHPSVPDVLEDWLDSKRQVLRLEEEAVSLLPSMDTLPPPVRCDSEAVGMLRTLFDTFFKSLEKLLSCVEKLQNKWGKLTEIDRVELNNCIDQVRRHVIAPEDCYHCFTELNFSEERVECTGSLLTLCNNTEVIRLSSNPALKEVAHLPPHAHTLLACACSVEQIHVESADVLVLGVSYNRLSDLSFLPRLPSLTVLDVSFNHLFDLAAVTEAMRGHPSLLNVRLFGNPISYLDVYRRQVSADCPQIERLDNKIVSYEERKPLDIAKLALQAQSLSKLAVSPRNKSLKGRRKSDKAIAGAPTTEELSEWDTLFHQTLAAAVQLVSASGLDQLAVGKSVCVNHMDDIKPGAPLWEQALDPRLAHPEDVLAASQIQGGGKKQTNKAAHQLPLFECHSSVVLLGTWGEEEEGSPEGVRIEFKVDSPAAAEGAATGAVGKLRKAVASALDIQAITPVPPEGLYSSELYLSPDTVDRLRKPFFLSVHVEDRRTFYGEASIRGQLEHPTTSGAGKGSRTNTGGHPRTSVHTEGSTPPVCEPVEETQSLHVGTLMFYPIDLFEQERPTTASPDSLPNKRVLYCKSDLKKSGVDHAALERNLSEGREALREAVDLYNSQYEQLREKQKELHNNNNNNSATDNLGATSSGRRSAGRRQSSMRSMGHFLELQPLQEELTQIQTRVVDLGSRVLATQHLLQRASDAAVTVELKFSIGRGPAPPEDSGELNASLKKKGAKKK